MLLGSTSLRFYTTQGLVSRKFEFGEFGFHERTNATVQCRLWNGPNLECECDGILRGTFTFVRVYVPVGSG